MASGPTSPTPSAYYNPGSSSWKTSPPCAPAASTSSSPTWPRAGSTHDGHAYAHPTSEPHTNGTGSSSPPGPPAAADTTPPGARRIHSDRLLPTPQAFDGNIAAGACLADRQAAGRQINLARLLCCPHATRTPRCHQPAPMRRSVPRTGATCPTAAGHTRLTQPRTGRPRWGPYEPAIRRWEHILGRPAPPPAMVGPDHRTYLNPAFTEWTMGLPEGHVTAAGLPRRAQLHALGNGVVPQQAARALRLLLGNEKPADGQHQ